MNVSAIQSAVSGSAAVSNILPDRQVVNRSSAVDNRPAQNPQESTASQALAQAKPETLDQAVKAVNDFVQPFNNALNFSVDQDSQTMVVKVIDQGTKEVIRQIPSEEMLALAKALDTMKGLLIRQKA